MAQIKQYTAPVVMTGVLTYDICHHQSDTRHIVTGLYLRYNIITEDEGDDTPEDIRVSHYDIQLSSPLQPLPQQSVTQAQEIPTSRIDQQTVHNGIISCISDHCLPPFTAESGHIIQTLLPGIICLVNIGTILPLCGFLFLRGGAGLFICLLHG